MSVDRRLSALLFLLLLWVMCRPAPAEPGDGIHLGDWRITPSIAVSAYYDSNLFLDDDDEESEQSTFYDASFSIDRDVSALVFHAMVWGLHEQHVDRSELDHSGFGSEVSLSMLTDTDTAMALSYAYSQKERVIHSVESLEEVTSNQGGLSAAKGLTDRIGLEARITFTDRDFEEDRLFDWQQQGLGLAMDYALTDKSAVYLAGTATSQDGSGNEEKGISYSGGLGVRSRHTDKTTASAGISYVSLSSDSTDIGEISFDADITWVASDKTTVRLNAGTDIEPALASKDNYNIIRSVSADLDFQLTDPISISLGASFTQFELANPRPDSAASVGKTDDVFKATLRCDYRPPLSFLVVFVEASATTKNSSVVGLDYDQNIGRAGITLSY